MPTAKQQAASRANAQKSTGPRTSAGKAVSRFNALKHGIYAVHQVLLYRPMFRMRTGGDPAESSILFSFEIDFAGG
jgi:hypothetical protein